MTVTVDRRHRGQPSHVREWRRTAAAAIPGCQMAARVPDAPLLTLAEVDFVLVSDRTIARIHGEFMDDPTPTDVITFHHGEILISLDTAQRQAAEHRETYPREVARYIVHGLLHLAGWNDVDDAERKEMHRHQEEILMQIWPSEV